MPQKMWKHRCPKGGGGLSWSGSPGCSRCGEPGEYDGWHPGMHEAMARYQSKYGLKPIGPHRKMADELLGSLNEKCESCNGRGLRDTATGSWQVCPACRGFGSFFTRPAYEIQVLRRRVLAAYPDAGADPVPNDPPRRRGRSPSPVSKSLSLWHGHFNCAVQTVTTVGYGNWVPKSRLKDPDINSKVLAVKGLSIGFMLLTTPLFAFLTGVAVNLVSEGLRPTGG